MNHAQVLCVLGVGVGCWLAGWLCKTLSLTRRDSSFTLTDRALLVSDDVCPECGGELDTGWECNACGYDAQYELVSEVRGPSPLAAAVAAEELRRDFDNRFRAAWALNHHLKTVTPAEPPSAVVDDCRTLELRFPRDFPSTDGDVELRSSDQSDAARSADSDTGA